MVTALVPNPNAADGAALSINTSGGIDPRASISTTPVIKSDATALVANSNRRAWHMQNLAADHPLFVRYGSGGTTSVYDRILLPGSTQDDGYGGSIDDSVYTGIVTVASAGTPRYICTERIGTSTGGGGGSGGTTLVDQVFIYTTDPNTEGLIPDDPTKPALAYKADGTGSMFTWDPAQQLWL